MNLKKTITLLSVGALAIAAVIGVVAYRTANAQATTPTAPSNTGPADNGFDPHGPGRGFDGGYSNEDLANALGITVDELNSATQKATDAALNQAVQAGLITQAQADQMRAGNPTFPMGGRGGSWLSQNGIDFDALLADSLGITVDKLQAATTQAFNARIDQAVTDGNLTQDQADLMKGQRTLNADQNFQSAMKSAFEAAVKQAVSAGVITQTQADQILKNTNNMGFGGFGGPGGFGGFGGHRDGGPDGFGAPQGAPNANPNNPTPSTTPNSGL